MLSSGPWEHLCLHAHIPPNAHACTHTLEKQKQIFKKRIGFSEWLSGLRRFLHKSEALTFGLQDPHKNGSNLTHLIHVCAVVCAFPHQKPNNKNK